MSAWKKTRRDVGAGHYVLEWRPVTPAVFTAADVEIEALTLDRLAAETASTDPWTAATNLFGGRP